MTLEQFTWQNIWTILDSLPWFDVNYLAIAAAAVEPAAGPAAVNPRVFNTTGVATFTATPMAVAIAAAVPAVLAICVAK